MEITVFWGKENKMLSHLKCLVMHISHNFPTGIWHKMKKIKKKYFKLICRPWKWKNRVFSFFFFFCYSLLTCYKARCLAAKCDRMEREAFWRRHIPLVPTVTCSHTMTGDAMLEKMSRKKKTKMVTRKWGKKIKKNKQKKKPIYLWDEK